MRWPSFVTTATPCASHAIVVVRRVVMPSMYGCAATSHRVSIRDTSSSSIRPVPDTNAEICGRPDLIAAARSSLPSPMNSQ
ncbi:MAG: hypothetical protein DMF87_09395 [Acidobacteria bacterium]|nr:MAG: hypothetical protein DMF87_09395 [Acidobacteriota bacterium]